ncbi:MAG TPA: DNA gyrase subunit B, partial [Rhodospirillaceae bacterium]|nr:DNA gyrase subunit B [Rhodospirillaceae bacterium]
QGTAEYIAKRMDALVSEAERGWTGTALPGGGFSIDRTLRGVSESHIIDGQVIRSSEARRLDGMAPALQARYARHGTLILKEKEHVITGPVSLVDAVMDAGKKGIGVQRYKG